MKSRRIEYLDEYQSPTATIVYSTSVLSPYN